MSATTVVRAVAQPIQRTSDNGTTRMVGYPIVFDTWTEINSWEGNFLERVDRHAVDDTLKERGDSIRIQFDHGTHPHIGSFPLGKPDVMRTDERGLFSDTPLSDTSYNRDMVIPLLRDEAIAGMSFRFQVLRDDWVMEPTRSADNPDGIPERTLKQIKLYEFGPVTYPAYEATQVGLRSADGAVKSAPEIAATGRQGYGSSYESRYTLENGVEVILRRRGHRTPHEVIVPTRQGVVVLKRKGSRWPDPLDETEWRDKVAPLIVRELDMLTPPDYERDLDRIRRMNARL